MDSMYIAKLKDSIFATHRTCLPQDCVGLDVTQQNHFFCTREQLRLTVSSKLMNVRDSVVFSSGEIERAAMIQVMSHTEFGLEA